MRNRLATLTAVPLLLALAACQPPAAVKKAEVDRGKLAQVNTQLAIQYIQAGEFEIALERLERALEADSEFVDAYNALGLLHSNLGQYDRAEENFRKAIRLDPGNSSALNNYGQFLCQLKRYDEGQKLFAQAIANPIYKNPELALNNAGICALNAGDPDTAETRFREALEIDPELPPTLYQMAELCHQTGRYLPARAYLQRFLEVGQHSPRSLWLGIQIERELGDRDTEASYALQLEKNFPDSKETRLLQESRTQ